MLLKFRFKNFANFSEWQELDLADFSISHTKTYPLNVGIIYGESSSGKSSIVKLLKLVIQYLKQAIAYDNEINSSLRFSSISKIINLSLNDFQESPIPTQSNKNKESLKDLFADKQEDYEDDTSRMFYITNDEKKSVFAELYFINDTYSFKYEIQLNETFPDYEALLYTDTEDNLDDSEVWKLIYEKTNIGCEMNQIDKQCIFDIFVDHEALGLKVKPLFRNVNQKNSLINYLKIVSKSKILEEFCDSYSELEFFNDFNFTDSFKSYNINKRFLIENKEKFLSLFNQMKVNVVDFNVLDNQKNSNNFDLMIGKKNNKDETIYLNSRHESSSIIWLFHLLYVIFSTINHDKVLIVDDFDKYLTKEQTIFLIGWLNEYFEQEKNVNIQIVLTLVKDIQHELISASNSNIYIKFDGINGTLKRIS